MFISNRWKREHGGYEGGVRFSRTEIHALPITVQGSRSNEDRMSAEITITSRREIGHSLEHEKVNRWSCLPRQHLRKSWQPLFAIIVGHIVHIVAVHCRRRRRRETLGEMSLRGVLVRVGR